MVSDEYIAALSRAKRGELPVEETESHFKSDGFTKTQASVYNDIADSAQELYTDYEFLMKPSRETSIAKTKLEESVMWAKRSIALNGVRGE